MSVPPKIALGSLPRHISRPLMAAGLILVAYLLSPAITAVQVEGFTAQLQLGAIAANAGLIDRANLLYPLHAEHFYLTRLGVALLLQALMTVLGSTGDHIFSLLGAVSFVSLTTLTLMVARRHSRVGLLPAGLALLLTPGFTELPFYLNDNVTSAAFGMLGLVLMPPLDDAGSRPRWFARGLLAGGSLGFAIVCRSDAVLLLPVVAGFAWLEARRWHDLVLPGVVVSVGILCLFAASYLVSGSTVLQALQSARFFDGLHVGFRNRMVFASVFVLFFGLPMLALLPVSLVQGWREGTLKQALVLVVLPLSLLAFIVQHSLETRQFYPLLAPFIAVHGGRGLERVGAALVNRRGWSFPVAVAWVAGTAFVWLAPPVFVPLKDGPRAVFGRVWSPPLWFQWQSVIRATLDRAATLVDAADQAPRIAVITTFANSDHYLRLRLWQRGYRPLHAQDARPGCSGGSRHGGGMATS